MCIRDDRFDGRDGILFLVKNNLKFDVVNNSSLNLQINLQVLAIKIKFNNLTLVNVYCPPNTRIELESLKNNFDHFDHPKLILTILMGNIFCGGVTLLI